MSANGHASPSGSAAPTTPMTPLSPAAAAPPPPLLTLDECRDAFYVAQRACERFASQLKDFVEVLDDKKTQADDEWIDVVLLEGNKSLLFHTNQHAVWDAFNERAHEYVESVKRLAELMAIAELKGEKYEEAELPENKARTVHPELLKFKLEKKARILGKIGGVPALGPGAVLPQLPTGDPHLKATGSMAAREITYTKAEGKDARYLADVFQFKGSDPHTQSEARKKKEDAQWQQEASVMLRRKAQAQKEADDLKEQLTTPFGQELTGVLAKRHQTIRQVEQEQEAVSASAYRRSRTRPGGDEAIPEDATPELAAKLKRRQEEQARIQRELEMEEAERKRLESESAPAFNNPTAPFGTELAAVMQRRNNAKAEAIKEEAARAARESRPTSGMPAMDSELAQKLMKRQQRVES